MRQLIMLILLGALAGLTLFSRVPPPKGTHAVVEVVIGAAHYKAGLKILPITKGMALLEGQSVLTGPGHLVILRLANGGQLVVYENSEITLKSKNGDAGKKMGIW